MSNSQAVVEASRHPKYYFDDIGCHIFRVEDTLYRLSMGTLCRHSEVLADMFKAGKEDLNEGQSDDNPITIPQLLSSTFDLFIGHHFGFPRTGYKYTKEELNAFLAFCDKYECEATKEFVGSCVGVASWRFHSAELMELAITYRLPNLFRMAFKGLTERSLIQLTKPQRAMIGQDVFMSLALAKTVLDEHCRIVAAEEPRISAHADDCQDPSSCEMDWHCVWWNGMGRLLLDGRNPQPYDDAVKCFKSEVQFGRMGRGCRDMMFQVLDEGEAFKHADHFVDDLCDRLIKDLHL